MVTWDQKELEPWVSCKHCNTPLVVGPDQFFSYFTNLHTASPCPVCGNPFDLWATVVAALEDNFFYVKAVELIGARSTLLIKRLRHDSQLEIDFSTAGIPASARILAINITPQGPLLPAEIRGSYFAHDHIPHKLFLQPVQPLKRGDHKITEEVNIAIMVTWFQTPGDLESEYLLDALYAYAIETRTDQLTQSPPRWDRFVVPANLALELVIGRFISDALTKHSLRSQGLNYAIEINPILPLVAKLLAVPLLPNHISNAVDKLRTIRNNIIHEGAPKVPLTRKNAATFLAASLFAFNYISWVRKQTGI